MTSESPETDQRWVKYHSYWRQKEASQHKERLERGQRAMQAARDAAQVLRERFGAQRVRIFGSTLHPESFHARSDIDLAVEGIDPLQILKAWCAASAAAPEFEFDLVTPDECRPEIWASVEAEGVDL